MDCDNEVNDTQLELTLSIAVFDWEDRVKCFEGPKDRVPSLSLFLVPLLFLCTTLTPTHFGGKLLSVKRTLDLNRHIFFIPHRNDGVGIPSNISEKYLVRALTSHSWHHDYAPDTTSWRYSLLLRKTKKTVMIFFSLIASFSPLSFSLCPFSALFYHCQRCHTKSEVNRDRYALKTGLMRALNVSNDYGNVVSLLWFSCRCLPFAVISLWQNAFRSEVVTWNIHLSVHVVRFRSKWTTARASLKTYSIDRLSLYIVTDIFNRRTIEYNLILR